MKFKLLATAAFMTTALLAGGQAVENLDARRSLADARNEVLDHLEVDVRFEQRQTHFAHRGVDVGGADTAVARQGTQRLAQAVAQSIEHWWLADSLIRPAAPTAGVALGRGFWRHRRLGEFTS